MWMAKRRGHKHVIEYMKTLPIVKQATVSLEKQLVVMEAAHKEAVAEAKERAVEEAARKAEEEARLAAEEKKRKEKEKAQRKMRDEIQAFDGVLRAKKKALMDPSYAFKLAETGQAKAMELLEDEKQSHKQDTNRCKAMRNRAEDNEIGAEMKKPEQRGAVPETTTGLGGPDQTSNPSSSAKSKLIRVIFGRIKCSRRVLETEPKMLRRNCRVRAH